MCLYIACATAVTYDMVEIHSCSLFCVAIACNMVTFDHSDSKKYASLFPPERAGFFIVAVPLSFGRFAQNFTMNFVQNTYSIFLKTCIIFCLHFGHIL